MKIIEIISSLASGGAERFVVDLCNEMAVTEDVTLVVLYDLKDSVNSFYLKDLSDKVKVITLNKHKGFDVRLFFKLSRLIGELNPDVVHTHMPGIIYVQLSLLLNKKPLYVHTIHNDAFKEQGKDIVSKYSRIHSFRKKLVIPVTISKESLDSFKRCYQMKAPMIFNGRNVPESVEASFETIKELSVYKQDDDTRIIINLARIQSQKRQDLLARVSKRLEYEGYNFCVLVIGRSNDVQMVERVKNTDSKRLFLLGEKSNPLEFLTKADAYTLSSSHEGMPISLIEALGVGCIPICTPVGGCKDVIEDGVNGFLSDDISEEAYYDVFKKFLALQTSDIVKMKAAAKESYKKYSMTECSKQYLSLFKEYQK